MLIKTISLTLLVSLCLTFVGCGNILTTTLDGVNVAVDAALAVAPLLPPPYNVTVGLAATAAAEFVTIASQEIKSKDTPTVMAQKIADASLKVIAQIKPDSHAGDAQYVNAANAIIAAIQLFVDEVQTNAGNPAALKLATTSTGHLKMSMTAQYKLDRVEAHAHKNLLRAAAIR
jgi:hypothetical protein